MVVSGRPQLLLVAYQIIVILRSPTGSSRSHRDTRRLQLANLNFFPASSLSRQLCAQRARIGHHNSTINSPHSLREATRDNRRTMGTFTFKWSVAIPPTAAQLECLERRQNMQKLRRRRRPMSRKVGVAVASHCSDLDLGHDIGHTAGRALSPSNSAIARRLNRPREITVADLVFTDFAGLTRLRRCTLPAPSTTGPRARSSRRSATISRRRLPSQRPATPSSTRFVAFLL